MRPQSDHAYPQKRRRCENGSAPPRSQPPQNDRNNHVSVPSNASVGYSRLANSNPNNYSAPLPTWNDSSAHGVGPGTMFQPASQNTSAPASANLGWSSPSFAQQQRSSWSAIANLMTSPAASVPNHRQTPAPAPPPAYPPYTHPLPHPAPPSSFVPPLPGALPPVPPPQLLSPLLPASPFISSQYRNEHQARSNTLPGPVSAPTPAAPPNAKNPRMRYTPQSSGQRASSSRPFSPSNVPPQPPSQNAVLNRTQLFNPGSRVNSTRQAQHHAPAVGRGGNAANHHHGLEGHLSIGEIQPLKEALALFRDGSPILVALTQTILQTGRLGLSQQMQREKILNFKGFPPPIISNSRWLSALNKHDLDILAWVFCVAKHGRKEEVAKRIISSLRSPLKFRIPAPSKKPMIPSRIDARRSQSAQYSATNSYPGTVGRPRGNMPSLDVPNTGTYETGPLNPQQMLENLQRQISTPRRGNAQQNRDKQMQSLCKEALTGYSFDVGENPYNKPLNPPLGYPRYVLFTAIQLNRGGQDPVLRFVTPPPIDPVARAEVKGGDVQVHLRCLRVEFEKPKSSWQQAWPFPATCRVNGSNIALNQAQRYTNGKLAGRDSATNITPYLKKYRPAGPNVQNMILLRRQVSSSSASSGQFVLFVQEILVLSHETVTKQVFEASEKYWKEYRKTQIEKGNISDSTSEFEMARKGVMLFLTDPEGLTVSSMKVSLRCPLGLTRIKTPVKGKRCQHVQCFDLDNFLEYSRRSSKFECPVCNKATAQPSMLVISPYIEHALKEHLDCDEVEIFADGTMVQIERKVTGVASDDDEDEKVEGVKEGAEHQRSKQSPSKACEVVDLTLDSDDDSPAIVSNSVGEDRGGTPQQHSNIANGDGHVENQNDGNDSDVQVDQDMVFTFRSDDFNWGDIGVVGNGSRIQQLSTGNGDKDSWTCDVIAIDSD
eukprot:gb/GEZJ01000830.1/.p1 GENE.gb/GEZJ01000830.1/~~gb/GEZJ01000830.1/.p1  ORF type:complete len:957 (-),score=128.59 gb/GEZJ01000830.1/:2720-5545(-)